MLHEVEWTGINRVGLYRNHRHDDVTNSNSIDKVNNLINTN